MSFLHDDVAMFRRPRTSDGNPLGGSSRPGFGRSISFQPSHKPTPSYPPPTSPKIRPDRARTWQRINRLAENVDSAYANTPIALPDQQPFLVYSDTFSQQLGQSPSLNLLITDPRASFFSTGGTFLPSLHTLYLASSLIRDPDPAAVSSANKRTEISKVEFYSETDFTRDKVRCPERSYMTAGSCPFFGADGPGLIFAAQGSLKDPAGLVYVSSTRPHKTRMLLTNFRGVPFNSPRDIAAHPLDGAIYFTDPSYGYEQGFRPKPRLPSGHIYRFDPESGDCRVVGSGLTRPCGLCFSPDGSTLYVSDADAGRNAGITLHAFTVSWHPSPPSSQMQQAPNSSGFGNISVLTPPSSGPNSTHGHSQNLSNGTITSNPTPPNVNYKPINPTAQLSPPSEKPVRPKLAIGGRTISASSVIQSRSHSRGPLSSRGPPSPLLSPTLMTKSSSAHLNHLTGGNLSTPIQSQPFLTSKRVFAFSPASGTGNIASDPDSGMVWLATQEGVEVWAPWGELVGKISVTEGNKGITGIAFSSGVGRGTGWTAWLMGGERLWGVKMG